MTSTTMRTYGAAYELERLRITALLSDLDSDAASTAVPACPEWSIHGVVSHLAGICSDVLAGNVAGAGTDQWTAAQVEARKGRRLQDVLAEWEDVGPRFAAMADDFPGHIKSQVVADAATHEHDVRGALGRPGGRDSEGVAIGVEFFVNVFLRPGLEALGLGPLVVRANGWTWIAGTGGPPTAELSDELWRAALLVTDEAPRPEVPAAGKLRADPFELFRAISGRRSARQIRDYDWSVDPEPYLPIFGYGPFSVRETDLPE